MQHYTVKLTFTTELLGTAPMDGHLYTRYIADKVAEEVADEEVATITEEKGVTGFRRENDIPILLDYMIKGFFKETCSMLRRNPKYLSTKIRAFKKIVDGMVFVEPRFIPIVTDHPVTYLERPLRASTPQGERVALAKSEMVQPSATVAFSLFILDPSINRDILEEWFGYGAFRGMGQWRNASYGRFSYELTEQ